MGMYYLVYELGPVAHRVPEAKVGPYPVSLVFDTLYFKS